ncbi:hypothetical protein C1X32_30980 [Pseudomonas sp. GW460-12-1-14-LB3]|nr:hypothetical protein C1X32_30980 [Pseudomonas sp. GW460-12-1-14-LB3]PMY12544.1 hypothetical protein C1X54_32885 [Pseudomonas sp. GW460-13]
MDLRCTRALCTEGFKCGSEPARDGGGTFSIDVTDRELSRAGSLLHWIFSARRFCVRRRSNVGVSLLAMTAAHSALM